ncbi:SRPBCC domain-containing protein [Nocardiopsis sp. CC223A]|uniref:SRPBCC domain-containing protein n=1 Tax=Nocardiopsis sp. CC223A TaxID=3044051 RepID=UPI00278BE96A|nr:SRPBCC domain-containing protein [Nocardiopsis sp. CC223A]
MSTDEPTAAVRRTDDGWELRFRRRFAHDRWQVWRAITESEHLAHWLPCDIVGERRAGAAIELPFWRTETGEEDGAPLHGEIRVWDPPSVFEWTWDGDVLRWELAEADGGTLMTFTTLTVPDPEGAAGTATGFHVCLEYLEALLDTGATDHMAEPDSAPLRKLYGEAIATAG